MDSKELKLLALRKPQDAHLPPPKLILRFIAFHNSLGCLKNLNPLASSRVEPNAGSGVGVGTGANVGVDSHRKITEILPWLFLGHFEAACDFELLTKLRITHIINVTDEVSSSSSNNNSSSSGVYVVYRVFCIVYCMYIYIYIVYLYNCMHKYYLFTL